MERERVTTKVLHPTGKWLELTGFKDFVGRAWLANRFWEQGTLTKMLAQIPMSQKDFTVVDCGANVGNHTAFFAAFGLNVVAFEPYLPSFECLELNAVRNQLHVSRHRHVLSNDRFGMECVESGNSGAVHFRTVSFGETAQFVSHTLDEFELPRCDLLKVDVEGHEEYVLEGAAETIKRCRPFIWVEVHSPMCTRDALRRLFQRIGYPVSRVTLLGGK